MNLKHSRFAEAGFPAVIVLVVTVMVVPLPTAVLDLLLVANISTAVLILLAGVVFVAALVFEYATSLWSRIRGFRRWRSAFLEYLRHKERYEEYCANRGEFFRWQTTREAD